MASLLVAAAINIAVSIAINELFPPPDINQEGPRLTELGFTSAAYGNFVGITFGTDRVSGNIIDTTDPAIEEVVNEESSGGTLFGLKGGGPQVNTRTFTYFFTGRISWGIEGASDLIRWWGDGKIILDATGTEQIVKGGISHIFYPGGEAQLQDPEEVTRRGVNISAYRHLTTLKVDRMPLADYGNRIPNFTAEIAYNSQAQTPVKNMVEPSGFSLSTTSQWDYDPNRNQLLASKKGTAPAFVADASSVEFRNSFQISDLVGMQHAMGRDGFAYLSPGFANRNPITKVDLDSGVQVGTLGDSNSNPIIDNLNGFANSGRWYQLSSATTGFGVKSTLFHLGSFPNGGAPNGAVVDADQIGNTEGFNPIRHIISTADGLTSGGDDLAGSSIGICDHDRGVFYIFQDDDNAGTYNLVKYVPNFGLEPAGVVLQDVTATLVKTFSRGTFSAGDDFEGTGNPVGWAVNRKTGELILSNGISMILYNPVTDTILAQKVNANFIAEFNYYSGSTFGYAISDANNGTLRVIDTRTLEITTDIKTDDIPWPSGTDGIINGSTSTWDDRVQAIYLGRTNSDAAVDFRVLKVFVNRVTGLGVGLDTVVAALSTTYQRQVMAGLKAADINVTALAGETVPGYTLNRKSTMKSALEPLRQRWDFDGVQSDWIMKFPIRGGAAVLTIPEEDVGELKRGRDQTDTPAIQETRMDDLALPMRLAVRYRNKDNDYQVDYEHDKRQLFPTPTMSSKTELTLDVPIVEQSQAMKRMAQKKLWTAWNERITYKTVVPWTYIKLDATDVFNMGVFGETAQLRMGEMDVGAGWAIEVVGIVEDTKQYSSTIAAGQASGHIGVTVPSSLPTRLIPLDAPILSLQDFNVAPLSNAYMVVGAFEAGWPGSTIMKSLDDVAYVATGTVNVEAAQGRVTTAPGAWNIVNGDFPNRWQEVADGGTMVIAPLRRADSWTSAANEQIVLAGANTIAVVRAADEQVEILNFQNAVLNDDNTVTLTRLLRGRLGTEDIADLGITANDKVILLSNATNVKEADPIIKQALTLSELDTVLFFKGVTIGTLLEDAPGISFSYTGRDIKPYSPVHSVTTPDGVGGLDVVWERRARGPLAAEWLDGTGEVVLNENVEQYEVILNTVGAGDFVTKVVNDVKTVNFTRTEVALGGADNSFAEAPAPISLFPQVILNFEGVDESTSFPSDGSEGGAWTANGTAQVDTAQAPAGGDSTSSLLLDGNSDYLNRIVRQNFRLGSNPVTIQAHFRLNATAGVTEIATHYTSVGDQRSWRLFVDSTPNLGFWVYRADGLTVDVMLIDTTVLTTGVDYHAAVVRKANGDWVLFLDGNINGGGPSTPVDDPPHTTADLRIGALNSSGVPANFFNGWIDRFEFLIGRARWETTFTPPTGTITPDPREFSENGEFEIDPLVANWFQLPFETGLTWRSASTCGSVGEMASGPPSGTVGANFLCATQAGGATTPVSLAVTLDLVEDFGLSEDEIQKATMFLNLYVAQARDNPDNDKIRVFMESRDIDDNVLTSASTGVFAANPATLGITTLGDWGRIGSTSTQDFTLPLKMALNQTGARFVRITLETTKFAVAIGTAHWGFDRVAAEIVVPATGLITKISQVSETGLKSPQHIRTVL